MSDGSGGDSGDRGARSGGAEPPAGEGVDVARRGVVSGASNLAMLAGLAGGYGAFAAIAGRYLYPARPDDKAWLFVSEVRSLEPGESLVYRAPSGETINVARQGSSGSVEDFIALSSVCPHLGCQVHYEAANDRFFCPCHNGVFNPDGVGVSGPPGDAGQSLSRYGLRIDGGLLFIELPARMLVDRPGQVVERTDTCGPGHDPCLGESAQRTRTVFRRAPKDPGTEA